MHPGQQLAAWADARPARDHGGGVAHRQGDEAVGAAQFEETLPRPVVPHPAEPYHEMRDASRRHPAQQFVAAEDGDVQDLLPVE